MARKRTKLTVSPEVLSELKTALRAATDLRDKERLQVVFWSTSGQHTLEELARLAGRARSTIQIWLDDFESGGVAGLLERQSPPGARQSAGRSQGAGAIKGGLKSGRWRTAGQVAAWLKETHDIKRAAKSLYRWLGKAGRRVAGSAPLPHSTEPVSPPPAFRDELETKLEQLTLPKDKPVKICVVD